MQEPSRGKRELALNACNSRVNDPYTTRSNRSGSPSFGRAIGTRWYGMR